MQISQVPAAPPTSIFGQVSPPPGVVAYDAKAATAGGGSIGLVIFLSNAIQIFTVVAGLYALFQLLLAGFQYINSGGDTGAHAKVRERVTMSVLGLAVIMASYTIAGILGLIFFGDATFILNPKIQGP